MRGTKGRNTGGREEKKMELRWRTGEAEARRILMGKSRSGAYVVWQEPIAVSESGRHTGLNRDGEGTFERTHRRHVVRLSEQVRRKLK